MLDNSLCCPVFLLQAELLEPAVKGTLNVLSSCAKFTSVRRVILTSSAAAVVFTGKPITPDVVIDEAWFLDPTICEKLKVCICWVSDQSPILTRSREDYGYISMDIYLHWYEAF